jgi:hypothetical protein
MKALNRGNLATARGKMSSSPVAVVTDIVDNCQGCSVIPNGGVHLWYAVRLVKTADNTTHFIHYTIEERIADGTPSGNIHDIMGPTAIEPHLQLPGNPSHLELHP